MSILGLTDVAERRHGMDEQARWVTMTGRGGSNHGSDMFRTLPLTDDGGWDGEVEGGWMDSERSHIFP